MSLIIPNTFATKTGAIQLSLLDENFTEVSNSIATVDADVATLGSTTTSLQTSITNLSLSTISGIVPISKGGTGLTTSGADGSLLISNGTIWITTIITGAVSYFAGSTAPTGWLKANGAAISRTTYASLFTAIGTTYGVGDGSTTFNIPDLRGEFLRVWDDGRGIDTGRGVGTSQGDAIRNISGSFPGNTDDVAGTPPVSGVGGFTEPFYVLNRLNYGANGGAGQGTIGFDASRQVPTAAENRPRNVSLLACIKF